MQYSWSTQRTLAHLKKHHLWMTPEQIKEYMSKPDATQRSSYLKTLRYWRNKNV